MRAPSPSIYKAMQDVHETQQRPVSWRSPRNNSLNPTLQSNRDAGELQTVLF